MFGRISIKKDEGEKGKEATIAHSNSGKGIHLVLPASDGKTSVISCGPLRYALEIPYVFVEGRGKKR